jgi:hypothetical protein
MPQLGDLIDACGSQNSTDPSDSRILIDFEQGTIATFVEMSDLIEVFLGSHMHRA